jgi:hypothetical protein
MRLLKLQNHWDRYVIVTMLLTSSTVCHSSSLRTRLALIF